MALDFRRSNMYSTEHVRGPARHICWQVLARHEARGTQESLNESGDKEDWQVFSVQRKKKSLLERGSVICYCL